MKSYRKKFGKALELFENKSYYSAMELFSELYNDGWYEKEIEKIIYNCFILPNEQEFEKNYKSSKLTGEYEYSNLRYDFIPVTNELFFVFDRVKKVFKGKIDLLLLDEYINLDKNFAFDNVLYNQVGDIRIIFSEVAEKEMEYIYCVLEGKEDIFYSFFKLTSDFDMYVKNFVLLKNIKDVEKYFSENKNVSLPVVRGENAEKIEKIIKKVHENRIEYCEYMNVDRVPFLSICIPSFNRGKIARYNVEHLLKCKYDIEIEIVVSNNHSNVQVEDYEYIRNIKDSRLKYYEFDQDFESSNGKKGFYRNIENVISVAKGRWITITSDEDILVLDKLVDFMEFLKNNPDIGVLGSSGVGDGFRRTETYVYDRMDTNRVTQVLDYYYLTGITFNKHTVLSNKILERVKKYRGNIFVEFYPHCAMAAIASENTRTAFYNEGVWDANVVEQLGIENGTMEKELLKVQVPSYATFESRAEQFDSVSNFILNELDMDYMERIKVYCTRIEKFFYLMRIAYWGYIDSFKEYSSWVCLCEKIYVHCEQYTKAKMNNNEEISFVMNFLNHYFMYYFDADNLILEQNDRIKEKYILDLNDIFNGLNLGKDLSTVIYEVTGHDIIK